MAPPADSASDDARGPEECDRCGHLADHECRHCGAAVCPLHHDGAMGLCVACAERATPDDRRGDTVHF